MARGRFVSQSVATDADLNSLSVEAELLYLKCIPHLDRDGLILGDAFVLLGKVAPRRPEWLADVDAFVNEWIAAGLVIAYHTKQGRVLWFKGFRKNQQGLRYEREAPSELPPPPGYYRTPDGLAPQDGHDASGCDPDTVGDLPELVRSESGVGPAQGKGEVKGEVKGEGEGQEPAWTATQTDLADGVWFQVRDKLETLVHGRGEMWQGHHLFRAQGVATALHEANHLDWIDDAIAITNRKEPDEPLPFALKILEKAVRDNKRPVLYTNNNHRRDKSIDDIFAEYDDD